MNNFNLTLSRKSQSAAFLSPKNVLAINRLYYRYYKPIISVSEIRRCNEYLPVSIVEPVYEYRTLIRCIYIRCSKYIYSTYLLYTFNDYSINVKFLVLNVFYLFTYNKHVNYKLASAGKLLFPCELPTFQ